MPENFSVDLFTIILLNVTTGAKKRNKAEAFPITTKKKTEKQEYKEAKNPID